MTVIDPLLRGLNEQQREAVEAIAGPLLILAGPGSGKTRVISHRVAYLIRTCGVAPRRVMAVTFTNKAARELKERIEALVGATADQMTAGTFHSICARILRIEAQHLSLKPEFVIYDDDDQIKLMKEVLAEIKVDDGSFSPRAVLSAISKLKAELVPADARDWSVRGPFDELVRKAYPVYQRRLHECGAVDFDDLINLTVQLLRDRDDVRERYQNRYLYLMVDEFQDTNVAQYELVKLLAGKHKNLAVVGDPDQSIYRFRSADIRNILHFERDFPDAKVVRLEQNYRSTQNILDAAQGVIATNTSRKHKDLWTENGRGLHVVVRELVNEQDEARNAIKEIDSLVAKRQAHYRDCAIMYRTNAQSRIIEQVCVQHGIPYRLVGGTRFYERREVKDIIAYLRVILNPLDSISLGRIINVPSRGIGQKTIDDVTRFARAAELSLWDAFVTLKNGTDIGLATRAQRNLTEFTGLVEELMQASVDLPVPALIQRILERTGYQEYLESEGPEGVERWENVQQLVVAAGDVGEAAPRETLARFLEDVALYTDADSLSGEKDSITLITLHAAKGLEYPVVLILGLEDGILPHSRSIAGPDGEPDVDELEEERRLLYVGMTRAKERLYLLRAYRRTQYGRNQPLPPSRFLADIPGNVRTKDEVLFGARPAAPVLSGPRPVAPVPVAGPTKPPRPVMPRATGGPFVAGDRVVHAMLGEGVVVSVVPNRDDLEVTVAFRDARAGVKRLLQSIARLEKAPPR